MAKARADLDYALLAFNTCPKCGQPGARDVPHVCLFAGLPYDKQPTTLRLAHAFEGDPWGSCKACGHPVYHEIHRERPS